MTGRPAARYGRQRLSRRARRWIVVVLTVLVVALGGVIAAVGYERLGTADIEATMMGYRLTDDETVSVTITVIRKDPARPAVCIVRARSKDGSETGRREILLPPSAQKSLQLTTVVKTSRPPVIADVYGCGFDVPNYLVAS